MGVKSRKAMFRDAGQLIIVCTDVLKRYKDLHDDALAIHMAMERLVQDAMDDLDKEREGKDEGYEIEDEEMVDSLWSQIPSLTAGDMVDFDELETNLKEFCGWCDVEVELTAFEVTELMNQLRAHVVRTKEKGLFAESDIVFDKKRNKTVFVDEYLGDRQYRLRWKDTDGWKTGVSAEDELSLFQKSEEIA